MSEEEKILMERIAFLRLELVKCSDAGQKFSMKKEIEQDEKRLEEIRNSSVKNNLQNYQKPITMAEQTEPKEAEKQEEKKTPWYKNKVLIGSIITILSSVIISVASHFVGDKTEDKTNDKPTTVVSIPTYSSYIVEGIVRDQDNMPVLKTEIIANQTSGFYTDSQQGNFSIQGVEIGKNGKIEFFIKGETLLRDTSQYDIKGNKIKILQALRINLKKTDNPTGDKVFISKTTYHAITLQGNSDLVDYVLFDNNETNKIQPKNGIVRLPNLGAEDKNIKVYFKDISKEKYDLNINNQTTEIAIK
jgi:hypothetical protein